MIYIVQLLKTSIQYFV